MKKKNISAAVLIVLSVILAAVSYMILPPSVITQFSPGLTNVTEMPKLAAIAIPFSLGIVGGVLSLLSKDGKTKSKTLLISAVGIAVFVIIIVVNKLIA